MKLTEKQIWRCNNTEDGGVHICLDHQNVVAFARAVEREIGFTKAELWIKRIEDAVKAEREACAKLAEEPYEFVSNEANRIATAIRARSNHGQS